MEHRNVPFSLEIFELVFPWIEAKSYFVRFQAPDLRFRWVSEREPCQHNIPRGVSVFEIIGAVGVVHVEEVGGHRTPRFRAVCLGLFAGWGPPLHGALGLKLLQCAPVGHRLKRNPYFFCLKLISFRLARAVCHFRTVPHAHAFQGVCPRVKIGLEVVTGDLGSL